MKTFGKPGSITPESFTPDLPPIMVIEGLTLLREMGMTRRQMVKATGMSEEAIRSHFNTQYSQWKLDDCWGVKGSDLTGFGR
ncbi:MAG TPA: hypothetical protein GXX48_00620 [Ochrobactrum intermedium]|uniref:Uncharacterized protein n=1 Tax=Brucella intermedia TaxID=94625 RepID=A0A7V6TXS0_9HYPH|nr:hypothetical protein [Brucella intermedia]HHV66140.1 hypothetical protein [Brucella intermedia]